MVPTGLDCAVAIGGMYRSLVIASRYQLTSLKADATRLDLFQLQGAPTHPWGQVWNHNLGPTGIHPCAMYSVHAVVATFIIVRCGSNRANHVFMRVDDAKLLSRCSNQERAHADILTSASGECTC